MTFPYTQKTDIWAAAAASNTQTFTETTVGFRPDSCGQIKLSALFSGFSGTMNFQSSVDGTTWFNLPYFRTDTVPSGPLKTDAETLTLVTATYVWVIPNGPWRSFRAVMTRTAGTITLAHLEGYEHDSPLSVGRDAAAIGSRVLTLPYFWEDWAKTALDADKWGVSITSSGAITTASPGVTGLHRAASLATGATSGSTAILSFQRRVPIHYGQAAGKAIVERATLEFQLYITTVTRLDNTAFFCGFADSQSADRASTNIIGFGLATDLFTGVADTAGTETTQAFTTTTLPAAATLYKIRITLDRVNDLRIYVDDVLEATVSANIPSTLHLFPVFSVKNDTTADPIVYVGEVRYWTEDVI